MESQAEFAHVVRFAEFVLDLRSGELCCNGDRTLLPEKPFLILVTLLERPGVMVTRDEIIKRLWPDGTFVDFNLSLNKAVNRLRDALCDSAEHPRFIETFPKRGYRFVAAVTMDKTQASSIDVDLASAANTGVSSQATPSVFPLTSEAGRVHGTLRVGRWTAAALVTGALVTVLATAYVIHDRRKSNRTIEMARIQITRVTDSGAVGVVALSPNGRYVCYSMREHDGWGLWLSQPAVGAASRILPADALGFEGITFSPDGNYIDYVRADKNDPGFKYLYSMPVLGGPPRLLVRDIDSPVSFSPDGQKFVYTRGVPTSNTIELRIANANGNANYVLATFPNTHGFQPGPTWSPDGRTIAVVLYHDQGQSYGLNTVSVADGRAREIYTNTRPIGRPHWLPEGDALFLVMQGDNDHGQLWTISYPAAVLRRISNDLTDYSVRSDLTPDAKNMAAIARHTSANIWVAPSEHLDQAKQVTSTALPLFQINDSPGGHLIADDQSGKLWTLSADGTQRSPFSDAEKTNAPTPCGRYMVFTAARTDAVDLMRTDSDGNNPRRLATGHLASWALACGSDGNEVFYMDLQSPHSIQRTAIEGGTPVKVADVLGEYMVGRMSISPDGRFLAYPFEVYKPEPVLKLAIIPARDAGIARVLTAPGGAYSVSLLWSRDGKGLQYILTQEGAANIWQQRLDGSGPVRLTNFTTGRIFDFHWSLDGKRLLLARGEISSDAVLLSNIR